MSYDPDVLPGDTQSDVLFREGQTPGGHVTYTPRLIAMDVKGQNLAITHFTFLVFSENICFSCFQHVFMCFYVKIVDELMTLCSGGQTGSLRTLRQEGSLYDPGKDTSAVTWYVCSYMCMLHPSIHPSIKSVIHFSRTTLMLKNQQIVVSLLDKSVSSDREGSLMMHKESPPAKNSFLEDLDKLEVSGSKDAEQFHGVSHTQWH